ncbi:MAG TPA: 3-oxoacyl-ACP reductase [Actinomycetota bacterium]|jgi:NAD(P)-dependent dehydrogenase (short-subunit alcohol dehydrogenase family)|nr:3-oxoacyl-ACP reductase [Actinomycetota bacterium]
MGSMEGHVALVMGGTGGIGSAISERFLKKKVRVAIGYYGNVDVAKEFLDSHPDPLISIHEGDVSNWDDCERMVEGVIEEFGRLDILVNSAGINKDRSVRKMSPEEWDEVVQVNLSGTFYACRAAINQMLEQEYGRIINISSVVGERGNFGQANYAASKSGLFGLTKTLALETASKGITVNAITPGFIRTQMVESMPDEVIEKVIAQIPVGRLGEPDEVARLVEFLADPESGYITGEIYGMNGGFYT